MSGNQDGPTQKSFSWPTDIWHRQPSCEFCLSFTPLSLLFRSVRFAELTSRDLLRRNAECDLHFVFGYLVRLPRSVIYLWLLFFRGIVFMFLSILTSDYFSSALNKQL